MTYEIISERKSLPVKVTKPSDAMVELRRYARARTERFIVITLNGSQDIIKIHLVTTGLINRTLIHPREVFHPAIIDGAVGIICAHNHPSGHLEPSPEDREITKRLREAGDLLGIVLLDHLIIGKDGYLSFVESGLLTPEQAT